MAHEGSICKRTEESHTATELVCPEHDEKFKLFCQTDQQLICVICRDGQKHRGHEFQPVQEAARLNKLELNRALMFLSLDNGAIDKKTKRQQSEMGKTKKKSDRLTNDIGSLFEKMHEFLRKREEELKMELQKQETNTLETMVTYLARMEEKLLDRRETEMILQSAMDIAEPDYFLKWWTERGSDVIESLKKRDNRIELAVQSAPTTVFKSEESDLHVAPNSLSLGPYETHLQFFVWKEMQQVVTPVPEHLTMKDASDSKVKVSDEGTSVCQGDRKGGFSLWMTEGCRSSVMSKERFQHGQHYWEVDVGGKLDWALGVRQDLSNAAASSQGEKHLLLMHDKGYIFRDEGVETPVLLKGKPGKVGLYLDCERQQLSFYNADNMSLIHSAKCNVTGSLTVSLSPGLYLDGRNAGPLRVCRY